MLWCCLWGRGQRGNNVATLLISSPLSKDLSCETGSFSHCANHCSPQPAVSLSFPLSQPYQHSSPPCCSQLRLHSPPPCLRFSLSTALPVWLFCLTVFLFNSVFVGVPCSLIFWHFWLFIDFILVVILFLVVQGSEGFPPVPPSWLELLI